MEASITLKTIAKKYDNDVVLADLSIGVESGSNLVIIGENGSGKSIILKILIGIIEKDAGSAYINGKDIGTMGEEVRMHTGYMPQNIDIDPKISIYDNLDLHAELFGVEKKKIRNRIIHFAELLNFKNHLSSTIETLSRGEVRKIQLARALLHDPSILLLDEPTSGIDPNNKIMIWDALDRIAKHKTILFVTQDFNEAERYADRIAILHNGNVKMDGSLDRLLTATKGLTKYKIRFSDAPSQVFLDNIKNLPKVLKPEINGNDFDFYSRERKEFFAVLKVAVEHNIVDVDIGFCRLFDLYLGLTNDGLE